MKQKQPTRIRVLFFALLTLLVLPAVSCVRSEKQVERAPARTCLDCHPEMGEAFRQGYVHAPVKAERCDQCHLPHGLIGGLFLREQEPDLCYSCHRDLKPLPGRKSVHQPVASGTCSSCHNAHNSRFPHLLKEPVGETCFRCHDRGLFEKKYIHSPLKKGCGTCHDPHSSGNVSLLNRAPDDLCRSCHQVERESFVRAHSGYPALGGCLQCHTPHAADQPMLLKKNVHAPVTRGQCNACHLVENDRMATRAAPDTLCLSCHDKPGQEKKSMHKPYLQEQCTACHAVHASDYRELLARPPEVICLDCHSQGTRQAIEKREVDGTGKNDGQEAAAAVRPIRSVHQPVGKGNCLECHNGHDAEQKFLLKRNERELCLTCHDPAVFASRARSHSPAKEQACATCHQPHESTELFLLVAPQETLCFSCHTREADERGRLSLHRPFAEGNCIDCHQLHDPKVRQGLLKYSDGNGELCLSCHKDVRKADDNLQTHPPVVRGRCERCHAPHSADYPFVLRRAPGELCLSCHKNVDTEIRNFSVMHEPARKGACLSCHVAHGSPHDAILNKGQPMLCLTCHREVAQFWRKGVAHQPAVKNCVQCHRAHGSNVPGMLNAGNGELCGRCHQLTGKEFLQQHGNIQPGFDSCTGCHDAHGGPDRALLYPVGHKPFLEGTCSPCHDGGAK